MQLNIETPSLFGTYNYPEAKEIMEQQQDIGWFAQEIKVEKDIQDYRVNMSPEAYNMVLITLQIFVEIEQEVGDIWDKIATWFPHSEIEGACSVIASMEKSVHAFFYQKMSDVLNINPEDTAQSQRDVKELKDKLTYIKSIITSTDSKPLLLATVALVEQVLLFSNFAMLKSFQSNGHNLIPNTVSGVDYVINDEVLHGQFASYLFNVYLDEANVEPMYYYQEIITIVKEIIHHEDSMIDLTFKGSESINGIYPEQLKQFIRSRVNGVLETLGLPDMYHELDTTIAKWFYSGANAIKMHDFFIKGTNSYSRTWDEKGFTRLSVC